MRPVDFDILSPSERKYKFFETKDIDIIKFTLQRAIGLDLESLKNLEINYSLIRHKLEFKSDPELLITILDNLQRSKINPITKSIDGLIYDIDLFFSKIN